MCSWGSDVKSRSISSKSGRIPLHDFWSTSFSQFHSNSSLASPESPLAGFPKPEILKVSDLPASESEGANIYKWCILPLIHVFLQTHTCVDIHKYICAHHIGVFLWATPTQYTETNSDNKQHTNNVDSTSTKLSNRHVQFCSFSLRHFYFIRLKGIICIYWIEITVYTSTRCINFRTTQPITLIYKNGRLIICVWPLVIFENMPKWFLCFHYGFTRELLHAI